MEYLNIARERYQFRKDQIPNSDGTISGMLNKTKVFTEQLENLDKDLAKLANEYISSKAISKEQIEKIKETNYSLISEFRKELTN